MATVLVVDDSDVDRRLVGGILQADSDVFVTYARSGFEALEMIGRNCPNAVVTDLLMPQMDGLELVASITTNYPLVPVILITGQGSEDIAVQALRVGASSYVPKSFLADRLLETVKQVLDIARQDERQIRLMDSLENCTFGFQLDNDGSMIAPLVDYLHRSIRAVGLCDEVGAIRVCVALEEALNNAIFHGNLELTSDYRDGDAEIYRTMISERIKVRPYSQRRVQVEVDVSREQGRFVIRDQGPGFDPRTIPDPTQPENLERTCGRGILLMQTFMDEIAYNELGNEVTLIKRGPFVESVLSAVSN